MSGLGSPAYLLVHKPSPDGDSFHVRADFLWQIDGFWHEQPLDEDDPAAVAAETLFDLPMLCGASGQDEHTLMMFSPLVTCRECGQRLVALGKAEAVSQSIAKRMRRRWSAAIKAGDDGTGR